MSDKLGGTEHKDPSLLAKRRLVNKQVKQNLLRWQKLLEFSDSKETLLAQLDEWCAQGDKFRFSYNNTVPHICIATALALAALMLWGLSGAWLYALLLPLVLLLYGVVSRKSNKLTTQLLRSSLDKYAALNYGVEFDRYHQDDDLAYRAEVLQEMFAPLFDRGNNSNEIQRIASGYWQFDDDLLLPYTIYHYHYVDKHVSTDAKGNQHVSYTHHDKWGVFVFGLPVRGIAIFKKSGFIFKHNVKYFPLLWTTSSLDFNKIYSLSGTSEMSLAKFFTPSMLMQLEDFYRNKSFAEANFVFDATHPVLHIYLDDIDVFAESYDKTSIRDVIALRKVLRSYRLGNLEYIKQQLAPLLIKIAR